MFLFELLYVFLISFVFKTNKTFIKKMKKDLL
jgi:hypothetical protein